MALFKILQGKSNNLPTNKVEGYCYVTTDEHKFYVDYKKSDGTLNRFALNAETATKATKDASGNTITKSYLRRYDFQNSESDNNVDDLRAGITFAYSDHHNAPTTGTIVAFDCKTDESYGLQLMGSYRLRKNHLYFRNHDGDKKQWGDWRTILDDNNYNLYAPSKTGDGASGTWDISITGNAATADLAQKAVEDNEGNTIDSFYLPLSAGESKKLTGPLGLTKGVNYGTSLPDQGFNGQLFFLENNEDDVLPISNGGTGATTAADARVNIGAVNMVTKTVTLSASSWSNDTQIVNVSGVTANNTIIVSYNPNSYEAYSDAAIRCIGQGNNTLTFLCENTPKVAINVNVVILN